MNTLAFLLSNGTLVLILIALMMIEVLILWCWWSKTGNGIEPLNLFFTTLAGFGILLALYFSIIESSQQRILASLLMSFVFHILDFASRWQKESAACR